MSQTAEQLLVRIDATTEQLRREMRRADTTVSQGSARINRSLARVDRAFSRVNRMARVAVGGLGLFAGALSVRGLQRFASNTISAADEIGKMSRQIDVGVERLQAWDFAATQSGVSSTALTSSLQRLTRRIGEARDGGGELSDIAEEIGLSLTTTEQTVAELTEAISSTDDATEQARIAQAAFGREGLQLVRMLDQGVGALNEYEREARRLGIVLSEDGVRAAERMSDQFDRFNRILSTNLQQGLLSGLTGEATNLSESISDPQFQEGLQNLGEFIGTSAKFLAENADALVRSARALALIGVGAKVGSMIGGRKGGLYGAGAGAAIAAFTELAGVILKSEEQTSDLQLQFEELDATTQNAADSAKEYGSTVTVVGSVALANIEQQVENQRQLNRVLRTDGVEAYRQLKREIEATAAAEKVRRDLAENGDIGEEALDRITEAYREQFIQLGELESAEQNHLNRLQEIGQEAEPMATAFEEAIRRIDGLFVDLWEDAFSGFDDFVDGVKSTFRRMLSEMAHAAITRPIMVSLGIAGGGLPGQASAATQAGGSGLPGLSGIGNLLGGGNIATALNTPVMAMQHGLNPFGQQASMLASQEAGLGLFGGSNLGFGLAGLGGGLIGQQFGGAGGIGGSIGGAAGFGLASGGGAIGSALSGLGAFAGPLGAIGGSLLGGALGGLFGGEPDDAQFMFGAGGSGPPRLNDPVRSTELAGGLRIRQDRGGEMNESERRDIEGAVAQAIGPQVAAINEILVATTGDTIAENLDDATEIRKFVKRHIGDKGEIDNGATVVVDAIVEAIGGKFAERLEGFDRHQLGQVLGAFATVARVRSAGSVTGQARDARETQTATEAFRDQSDALRDLVHEYDGSVESTQELAAAFQRTNQSAVQLAAGLMEVSDRVDATLGNLAERIRQDLMGEEELYNYRRSHVDSLVEALDDMSDPREIQQTIDTIDEMTRQMWQSLEDGQREAMGGGFLDFLEETNELAQRRLDEALENLDEDMGRLGDDGARFEAAAGQMNDAAERYSQSSETIAAAAKDIRLAADEMRRVGQTPVQVALPDDREVEYA